MKAIFDLYVIADDVEVADDPWSRMKGLLGRQRLLPGQALLITSCNSIHMFFMKFPIDVVFLDKSNVVVGLVRNIPPFALSPIYWKAYKALELSAGVIEKFDIRTDMQIQFDPLI